MVNQIFNHILSDVYIQYTGLCLADIKYNLFTFYDLLVLRTIRMYINQVLQPRHNKSILQNWWPPCSWFSAALSSDSFHPVCWGAILSALGILLQWMFSSPRLLGSTFLTLVPYRTNQHINTRGQYYNTTLNSLFPEHLNPLHIYIQHRGTIYIPRCWIFYTKSVRKHRLSRQTSTTGNSPGCLYWHAEMAGTGHTALCWFTWLHMFMGLNGYLFSAFISQVDHLQEIAAVRFFCHPIGCFSGPNQPA